MWRQTACIALAASACGDAERSTSHEPALDTRLARDLTARFGVPVTTRCTPFSLRCVAAFADGSEMHVDLVPGKTDW